MGNIRMPNRASAVAARSVERQSNVPGDGSTPFHEASRRTSDTPARLIQVSAWSIAASDWENRPPPLMPNVGGEAAPARAGSRRAARHPASATMVRNMRTPQGRGVL